MSKAITRRAAAEVVTAFDKAHQEVSELRLEIRKKAYALGLKLIEIREQRLWAQAGFRGFTAYLGSLRGASKRTLYRCIARALSVPLAIAEAHDAEKIDAALALLDARGVTTLSLKAFNGLRVEGVRDGKTKKISFADATPEELLAGIAAVRRESLPPVPTETRKRLERLRKRLGSGPGALCDVVVRRRGKRTVVQLEIPEERLAEFDALFR